MTDDNNSFANDWMARYARVERQRAEIWPSNKQAVFACLAAAEITKVTVTFDGCGDSGQIESIAVEGAVEGVVLPATMLLWQTVDWQTQAPISAETSLKEAVENLVYDALERTHCGWENNEGAYGEITFDVTAATVTLDYNERVETSEYHQHIL